MKDIVDLAFEEGRRAERERIVAFLRDPAHCERGGDLVGEMLDRLAGIIEGLEALKKEKEDEGRTSKSL